MATSSNSYRKLVTAMVQKFFQTGELEAEINNTNICLIPKTLNAKRMCEYRPISLCNVASKVISKLMARRMKSVLPHIISETQAAFVERRLISDNILVAHELLHALSSDNKCSSEYIAIKTDISKAYDRVEWAFLDKAMKAMGFSEAWRGLIMSCVRSVRYQVLINGSPSGRIIPTRGLRQGDPLSPYLFVMCTEVLVQMLKRAEETKKISGLRVARRAPPVTHLLFANDSMMYCKGTEEELEHITYSSNLQLGIGAEDQLSEIQCVFWEKHSKGQKRGNSTEVGYRNSRRRWSIFGSPRNFQWIKSIYTQLS